MRSNQRVENSEISFVKVRRQVHSPPTVHPSRFSLLGSCSCSVRSSKFELRGSEFGVRGSKIPVRRFERRRGVQSRRTPNLNTNREARTQQRERLPPRLFSNHVGDVLAVFLADALD